jgi:hypothetical protein
MSGKRSPHAEFTDTIIQPWQDAPYKLWSLPEMLDFLASEWNEVVRALERLSAKVLDIKAIKSITEGDKDALIDPLRQIADSCALLGLNLSASYAEEIIGTIRDSPSVADGLSALIDRVESFPKGTGSTFDYSKVLAPETLSREFSILKKRIDDELKNRKFLAIAPDRSRFYRSPELFGADVTKKFPSASYDIEEAGTCYACDRPTACVFHLMRVMEVGLRVLGSSLGNPDLDAKRNPSWERILKPCDDELKKPVAQRSSFWRQDDLFFSNATANLRAVKDAWRNPTLHIEANYDGERAHEILNTVKAFMRHLAQKLAE